MFRIGYWLFIVVMCFAGTSVTAQNTASLNDSQIAHVFFTAGQVDIAAANLALDRKAELFEKFFDGQIKRGFQRFFLEFSPNDSTRVSLPPIAICVWR